MIILVLGYRSVFTKLNKNKLVTVGVFFGVTFCGTAFLLMNSEDGLCIALNQRCDYSTK